MRRAKRGVKGQPSAKSVNRELDVGYGERLVAAMRWARVRPKELASKVPVHPTTISRWRKGMRPAEPLTERAAGLLGISANWLKTGDGAMVEGEVSQGEGRVENAPPEAVRETVVGFDASNPSILPSPSIHPDPLQRTAVERLYAQLTTAVAQRQMEGGELRPSLVQNWLNLLLEKHHADMADLASRLTRPAK